MTHTVGYSVTFKEYLTVNSTPHTATFNFQIDCPLSVVGSTLDLAVESLTTYDISLGVTENIDLP